MAGRACPAPTCPAEPRSSQRTARLAIFAATVLALASLVSAAGAPPDEHVLSLRIEPEASTLEATDTLTTAWRPELEMRLHPDLEITSLTCGSARLERQVRRVPDDPSTRRVTLPRSCTDEAGRARLTFTYRGKIHDPVTREQSLHFVTGDRTGGIISADGVFLDGGTGHYPDTGAMALYDVTVNLPAGWSAVSQGERVTTFEPPAGRALSRFTSRVPSDGLALSAGRYVVRSVQAGDTTVSTYFFESEAHLADAFLPAAARYLERFETFLGPYPFPKFDIVENFFTTGYGFPSYTLLGRDVVRMGERALRPGYLDHEIAHCWWGNHVYVDVSQGNWCEGLTSYVSNYLNVEMDEGAEAAAAARRRTSQRYSVDVAEAADFPPSKFVTKTDDVGSSIGYGKVSMVFHVLRGMLGDETFWKCVRAFAERHGGTRAAWSDIEQAFEDVSGRDLTSFFDQWVERAGLPKLRLAEAAVGADDTDDPAAEPVLRIHVAQSAPYYDLVVPVVVTSADGSTSRVDIELAGERGMSHVRVPESPPVKVALDPDFALPRRLSPEETPASLSRTLAGKPVVVYPSTPPNADAATLETRRKYRELAEMAAGEHGGRAVTDAEVAPTDVTNEALLLLGRPDESRVVAQLAGRTGGAGVDLGTPGSFRAGQRRWSQPSQALLVSVPQASNAAKTVTVFAPNGSAALDAARFMFFYGWDTWAALENGRAKDRGVTWPETATSVVRFERAGAALPGQRMMETVRQLVRPEFEGRDAGTPASKLAASELVHEMQALGLSPVLEEGFERIGGFVVADVSEPPLISSSDGSVRVPVAPWSGWLAAPPWVPSEFDPAAVRERVVEAPRGAILVGDRGNVRLDGLDLEGALAVIVDRGTPSASEPKAPPPADAWWAELPSGLSERGAVGLLVVRPDAPTGAHAPFAAYPSLADEKSRERFEKARQQGGERGVLRAASGMQARAHLGGRPYPVLFAASDAAASLEGAGPGARLWEGAPLRAAIRWRGERIHDTSLVGLVRGTRKSKSVVLLGAHRDAVGLTADGTITQGAVDNASGVAVVLEVARRLVADPPAKGVAIVLYGAEEWGLHGSRGLVWSWPLWVPVEAVVNVDSVGMASSPLHVIGRSREPRLAGIIERHAVAEGLVLGKDIDQYADAHGSDHWSWVGRGVPAVDVFQADYKILNSAADKLELVDEATLVRLADALERAVRELAESRTSATSFGR